MALFSGWIKQVRDNRPMPGDIDVKKVCCEEAELDNPGLERQQSLDALLVYGDAHNRPGSVGPCWSDKRPPGMRRRQESWRLPADAAPGPRPRTAPPAPKLRRRPVRRLRRR